ncbi:MAG: hypothetical protein AAF206_25735, partial [Bacteroidota bacterium]
MAHEHPDEHDHEHLHDPGHDHDHHHEHGLSAAERSLDLQLARLKGRADGIEASLHRITAPVRRPSVLRNLLVLIVAALTLVLVWRMYTENNLPEHPNP